MLISGVRLKAEDFWILNVMVPTVTFKSVSFSKYRKFIIKPFKHNVLSLVYAAQLVEVDYTSSFPSLRLFFLGSHSMLINALARSYQTQLNQQI